MDRRNFLKNSKYIALVPFGTSILSSCSSSSSSDSTVTSDATASPLYIPPVVQPDATNMISLQANEGTTAFYDGVNSETKGFIDVNNDAGTRYLGPTIRVSSINTDSSAAGTAMVDLGSKPSGGVAQTDFNAIKFSVFNNTSQAISTHWHGIHIDGFVDGGPLNAIDAGTTWQPTLDIYQPASTNFYHTHIHTTTAAEVYKGLAGLFIIDDDNSEALDAQGLPSTYGTDDIPLIIQDKNFNNQVMDSSQTGGRFAGDTFLVNGTVSPDLEVEAGLIRFRILNASNARFYDFTIHDSSNKTYSFQKIASDGGFLSAPVTLNSMRHAPAERNEIVIDFSQFAVGDVITLKSAENENTNLGTFSIMTFTVIAQTNQTVNNSVPSTLNASIANDRTTLIGKTPNAYAYIHLGGGQNQFASLRQLTALPLPITTGPGGDLPYIDFNENSANFVSTSTQTTANYTEQWWVRGNRHPFHLHGCSAMIVSINGNTTIPEHMQGWKDVIEVTNGNDVVFNVQFNERAYSAGSNAGPGAGTDFMFMMHCHILGHEDDGMMGVFEVI